jgi:hypothetical protein
LMSCIPIYNDHVNASLGIFTPIITHVKLDISRTYLKIA